MWLSLSEADSKTCFTVNVQKLTNRAITVIYRLTTTYAEILQMFRKGRLSDNGQHNITKEKKEFQSLNEKFKKSITIYSSLTMAQWSEQQFKMLP